jgi:hypothetical protein
MEQAPEILSQNIKLQEKADGMNDESEWLLTIT